MKPSEIAKFVFKLLLLIVGCIAANAAGGLIEDAAPFFSGQFFSGYFSAFLAVQLWPRVFTRIGAEVTLAKAEGQ